MEICFLYDWESLCLTERKISLYFVFLLGKGYFNQRPKNWGYQIEKCPMIQSHVHRLELDIPLFLYLVFHILSVFGGLCKWLGPLTTSLADRDLYQNSLKPNFDGCTFRWKIYRNLVVFMDLLSLVWFWWVLGEFKFDGLSGSINPEGR